jgi:hypothetical protein
MIDRKPLEEILLYQPSPLAFGDDGHDRVVRKAILRELSPADIVEQMWVAEIASAQSELMELQRYKGLIVKSASPAALRNLLQLYTDLDENSIEYLVERRLTNKAVRQQVASILDRVGLDESAIGAEAYRQSIGDMAMIDRRLTELAERRDKLLGQLEDYRAGLSTSRGPARGLVRDLNESSAVCGGS